MSRRNGGSTQGTPPGEGSPLIFDRPDLQERRQRWLHWALTLVAWAVWVYLWLPLVTFVAWYLGFRTFIREIVIPDPATMVSTGLVYLGIVAALALLLIGWSRYNLRRFGGEDRRRHVGLLTDEELLEAFHVAPETLSALRTSRIMTVHHDEDGGVQDVQTDRERIRTVRSSGPASMLS